MSKAGFNKLAKFYSGLEYIAFGNLLLRSRFALLSELKDLKQVLIIGGGNGRLLKRIIEDFPDAKIDFLEQSPAMIKIAKSRLTASQLERVGFIEADIFSFTSTNLYDCIFS
ncbi:MAG TPA: class I SAM-dependent methyltransferase, partial [Trueperaceae bacterium]|nr:class I SAM-dependent methyltransferase [Trueperaceae bacterium]